MSPCFQGEPEGKGLAIHSLFTVDVSTGAFLLLIGPADIRYSLTCLVASLAEADPVRVIDAGNPLDPVLQHQLARGHRDLRERVRLKRAFTCQGLLALLEAEPASPLPLVLLDLLGPFYAGSVHLSLRRELLAACLDQLQRLRAAAGGAVSLSPPPFPLRSARALFRQVQVEAPRFFTAQLTFPAKSLRRLY